MVLVFNITVAILGLLHVNANSARGERQNKGKEDLGVWGLEWLGQAVYGMTGMRERGVGLVFGFESEW